MEYIVSAYTDIGTQKKTNQDSLCVRRAAIPQHGEAVMAVLCDGMGGLQKGELASACAVQTFGTWFDQNIDRLPELCAGNFEPVRQQWTALALSLHNRIRAHSQQHGIQMGTTLTGILAFDGRYLTVNIGDSRIYEKKYELKQLTQDQSLVAKEIALGRITKDQARHHPQRNILLQCLGVGDTVAPVFTGGTVIGGGLYLLCSDGLVQELSEAELDGALDSMVLTTKELLTQRLTEMTNLCKQRGERDNITAILCRTAESQYVPPASALQRTMQKLRLRKKSENQQAVLLETAQIVHTPETI